MRQVEHSARPWIGTRTTSSARARSSLRQAPGLVAEQPGVSGRARSASGQSSGCRPGLPSAARTRSGRCAAAAAPAASTAAPATTGRWNRLPAEARTTLGLYEVDGGVGEHHGVGAGGVGGSQDGAGVAGVADVRQQDDEPRRRRPATSSSVDARREPADRERCPAGSTVSASAAMHRQRLTAWHGRPALASLGELGASVPLRGRCVAEQLDDRVGLGAGPRGQPAGPRPGTAGPARGTPRSSSRATALTRGCGSVGQHAGDRRRRALRCELRRRSRPSRVGVGRQRSRGRPRPARRRRPASLTASSASMLAVDLDLGGLQALDEAVVGHAVGAGRRR